MIIKTQNLCKNFKSYTKKPGLSGSIRSLYKRDQQIKKAVTDFSFEVPRGEILGLLGPNGAGKTTLMKMFTGIVVPSAGEIEVLGHRPYERKKEFRKKMALVMGQKSQLWWDIPALDSFLLLQKYYEIPETQFKEKVSSMSEMLGVTALMQTHVRKLSLGERMKMELMASLLHSPEILFLDEPTIGLDLLSQDKIRAFLKSYQIDHGVSIILTSHYMADIQSLCSRIVLVLGGEKAYDGAIEDFEKILGTEKFVSFNFQNPPLENLDFFNDFDPKWGPSRKKLELRIPETRLREVCSHIISKYPVIDFQTEKLPIENVMKQLMERPEILTKNPQD